MAIPLDVRRDFIEHFLVDEYNRNLQVYDWYVDHIFEPLDGYKLAAHGWTPQNGAPDSKLCTKCKKAITRIVSNPDDHEWTKLTKAHSGGRGKRRCPGLDPIKIFIVVVSVKRQQGKTTGGVEYAISEIFLGKNSSILYMAASKQQAERVFEQKFAEPIERHPELKKRVKITGDEIRNIRKGNYFKFIPASAKSAPSGTFRLLIIDEARDVAPATAAALIPSILGAKGLECPFGHYTTEDAGVDDMDREAVCPHCGEELVEWHGRVLIMSSAGDDSGWFRELVERLENQQVPVAHLFRTDATINKHFNEEAAGALEVVFGELPSMKTFMMRELHNEFAREGDEYLPPAAIKAVQNKKLANEEASDWRCVAFLDASKTTDLTSLVICGDPGSDVSRFKEQLPAFLHLVVLRIDVWDPAKMPHGRVDDGIVYRDLRRILPKFPRLLEVGVDINLVAWAQELVDKCRRQHWGQMVKGYTADALFNREIWESLERRVRHGKPYFQIPIHGRLYKELKNARIREDSSGRMKVVDSSRGDRRGGRGVVHRDIGMSLAACSWLADRYAARATGGEASAAAMRINNSIRLEHLRQISAGIDTMEF